MPSTSRDAGMKLPGSARRRQAMVSSSAVSPAGRTPASGVPACGTNVMTRTCSQPAARMATMEAARSAAVSPMPVSRPSSTSRPARRAASRASTRASNGCPTRRRSYSSRVWVSWYSAYQSAPASRRSRSTASGSTPGEIMTGVPVAPRPPRAERR